MTNLQLLHCHAADDNPVVSVLLGRRYAIAPDGRCRDRGDFSFTLEPELYEGIPYLGKMRPLQLRRDIDLWGWKDGTDLVVQGTLRTERPIASMPVTLRCEGGAQFSQTILVTGDRRVEKGPTGLRLSAPQPFTAMPMRWDKAYGGTDERAEETQLSADYRHLLESQLEPEALNAWSEFSYPRNPAGKGYLIDLDGALGLPWPNLEFPDEPLSIERLVMPLDRWGERPYPACWDWLPYHWAPRSAFVVDLPETFDGLSPRREVALGLLPERFPDLGNPARPFAGFARGAHPFLQRQRLTGAELITVPGLSADGRELRVRLPGERPIASLWLNGASQRAILPAELDLVFVDAENGVVTLVWRASLKPAPRHLHPDWEQRSRVQVEWSRVA